MRHSLLYPCIFGFVIGIAVASCVSINIFIAGLIFFAGIIFLTILFLTKNIYAKEEVGMFSVFCIISVVIISSAIGVGRYDFFVGDHGDKILQADIGRKIDAEGVIIDEPDVRDAYTLFTISLESVTSATGQKEKIYPTKIIAKDNPYSVFNYGDKVEISGELALPKNIVDKDGRTFDYVDYLAKDKIFYTLQKPHFTLVGHHEAGAIKEFLFAIKKSFIDKLDQTIAFPQSRLAAGLTVAGKRALPSAIQNEFQNSGTLQVVVLSGYNVTIIAEGIALIFSFLSKKIAGVMSIACIVCFAIMAGGSATVVRGSVMAVIVVFGALAYRKYSVSRALVLTACIMLAFNPMLLIFDASFQLSFLATAGLIFISPLIEPYLLWLPQKLKLREVCVATISAQIAVTPLLLYTSGMFSIVSVPANFLISLAVPFTMLLSFSAAMIGYVSVAIASPVSWLAFFCLSYILAVVHFFASLPYASIALPYFPVWVMLSTYASCCVVVWYCSVHETREPATISEIKKS